MAGRAARLLASLALLTAAVACHPRATEPAATGGESPPATPSRAPSPDHPSGGTCRGRADCAGDQVCVDGVCQYRNSSVTGEVLAAAAAAQVGGGDLSAGVATYDEAIAGFREADAPVPASVLCAAAHAALALAATPEAREQAAARADDCFRGSLPGDPGRARVVEALARVRYEGLDLSRFGGGPAPPVGGEGFFSLEPTRPTLEAVAVEAAFAPSDMQGAAEVAARLGSAEARRAAADCFVSDWEHRHERRATAQLLVRLDTRVRESGGSSPTYAGAVSVVRTRPGAEDGFEACLAEALDRVVRGPIRLRGPVGWEEPLGVEVSLP